MIYFRKKNISNEVLNSAQLLKAKCVFVKATEKFIYTTDTENGMVYMTETNTWTTE